MNSKYGKANWFNILFIGANTLVALIGGPWYYFRYGLSASEITLMVFFIYATGFGITAGYHRLYTHQTYKAHPVVHFFMLFFGAAAFQQSALAWTSQHRNHHQYVDTDADPYNIKKGFFWAHMGWLIFGKFDFFYDNVDDLIRSKLIMHQARHYVLWGVVAGIVTPVAIGALTGHALGAFIFSVCFRITFVYHSTWCINSVCHMFGKTTYDADSSSRDNWMVAVVALGEGYHNFHHRFPSDYRNGVRWYQPDFSKWLIFTLEKLGLVWNVKRIEASRIEEARRIAAKKIQEKNKRPGMSFRAAEMKEGGGSVPDEEGTEVSALP
ncbi:MAG TPA: acyl-CoA desaturase [Verrucomicrobiae bacterium]|nr:acyl-CoA desaturase [Verrucomicrobiae bacterium]